MTGNWKEKQKQTNDVFNHSIVITRIDNYTVKNSYRGL